MRDALSDGLVNIAKSDPRVLLLTGDHGYALFDDFRRVCPDQYINAGIAEQNMVGMAAGLARAGFRPFVYGLSSFIPIRVIEQMKIDVAHDGLPVIFIGDGAGFVYSYLGTTHQSTEDIACVRSIPGVSVYSPADRFEVTACIDMAYQNKAPAYLRIGKSDIGDVHSEVPRLNPNSVLNVWAVKSSKYAIISTGSLVRMAVDIASSLPDIEVWSMPVIKPIDLGQIINICKASKGVVVLEEHSKHGGLGSLVAEIASEYSPLPISRIAVEDEFTNKCGSYEFLLQEHGLDRVTVKRRIYDFMQHN